MALIRQCTVVDDPWPFVADEAPLPRAGNVLVSVSRLRAGGDALLAEAPGRVGVSVASDDELEPLLPYLFRLPIIAIQFPKFADGRGYSKARLLRERYGYTGELRAVGNVLPDQLFYMQRCGIDAFELQDDKPVSDALAALRELTVTYQAAADDPRPLYRRTRRGHTP